MLTEPHLGMPSSRADKKIAGKSGRGRMTVNEQHFCFCPSQDEPVVNEAVAVKGVDQATRAALLAAAKWEPGSRIRVRFLGGDPGLQRRAAAVAREWTGPQMANLQFDFVELGGSRDPRYL